jgi:hypothetical protein
MLALLACKALDRSTAFPPRDITEQMVRELPISTENEFSFYVELIEPLRNAGRPDLARAIERALANYRSEYGLRGWLKKIDRVHFGGGFLIARRAWRSRHCSSGGHTRMQT